MAHRLGISCAGLLLIAVVGCSPDSFLVPFGRASEQQLVCPGSVIQVSTRLQEALAGAGVSVVTKYVEEDLRLAGVTKQGKVFCFHLRREKGAGADKTLIRLQWDKDADETFWRTIVLPLANPEPE